MNETQILELLTRTLRGLLDDENIVLTLETRREDVPDWDSLGYVNLIVSIEAELNVQFKLADVEAFETVGDLVKGVQSLLA